MAEIYRAGSPVFDDRVGLELDDVGGRRMVFPDGLRNVRAGRQGFSVARTGFVFADRGGARKHPRDAVGTRGYGCSDRVDGPVDLASGDHLGGQIQVRAGRKRWKRSKLN